MAVSLNLGNFCGNTGANRARPLLLMLNDRPHFVVVVLHGNPPAGPGFYLPKELRAAEIWILAEQRIGAAAIGILAT